MTDLADRIVTALFDLADSDCGLVKSRAIDRVREVLALAEQAKQPAKREAKPSFLLDPTEVSPEMQARARAAAEALGPYLRAISKKRNSP